MSQRWGGGGSERPYHPHPSVHLWFYTYKIVPAFSSPDVFLTGSAAAAGGELRLAVRVGLRLAEGGGLPGTSEEVGLPDNISFDLSHLENQRDINAQEGRVWKL